MTYGMWDVGTNPYSLFLNGINWEAQGIVN